MSSILSISRGIQKSRERDINFQRNRRFKDAKKAIFGSKELSDKLASASIKAVAFSDASFMLIDKAKKVYRDFSMCVSVNNIYMYMEIFKKLETLINLQSADLDSTSDCQETQENISTEFGRTSDAIAEMCFAGIGTVYDSFLNPEKYALMLHYSGRNQAEAKDFFLIIMRLAYLLNKRGKDIFEKTEREFNATFGERTIQLKTAQTEPIINTLEIATKGTVSAESEALLIELVDAIDNKVLITF